MNGEKIRIWRLFFFVAFWLLAFGGATMNIRAAEIPADAIDFMYINQDKLRFGRPTVEEPLTQDAAEAVIRLQLPNSSYAVAITFDTSVYDAQKIAAVRSVLTPWLLEIGAREIYFKDMANARLIGNPVIIEIADEVPTQPTQNVVIDSESIPSAASTEVSVEVSVPTQPNVFDTNGAAENNEPDIVITPPKIKLTPLNVAPTVNDSANDNFENDNSANINSAIVSPSAPVAEPSSTSSAVPALPIETPNSDEFPIAEELDLLNESVANSIGKSQSPVASIAIAKPVEQSEVEEIDDPQNQNVAPSSQGANNSANGQTENGDLLPDDFNPVKVGE